LCFVDKDPCGLPFCLCYASQGPKREFNDGHKIRVNLHHGKIEDAVVRAVIVVALDLTALIDTRQVVE